MRCSIPLALLFCAAACGEATVEVREAAHAEDEPVPEPVALPPGEPVDVGDGLLVEQTTRGHGPAAGTWSEVTLHYSSFLAEGYEDEPREPFDSSTSRHVPLVLRLGSGPQVIEGLARGLVGLRAGDEVVLRVPSELGWGKAGNPSFGVPADADLVYEVRVLEVNE